MPIPFDLIPVEIRILIVQKQGINDFVNFYESSCNSFDICEEVKTRFTFVVDYYLIIKESKQIPGEYSVEINTNNGNKVVHTSDIVNAHLRLEIQGIFSESVRFTSRECDWLANLVLATGSTITSVVLSVVDCSPEQLNVLLSAAQTERLRFEGEISMDFLEIPAMKQLNVLQLKECHINDEHWLALNQEYVYVHKGNNITTLGINTFLKQWQRGERDFTSWTIMMNVNIDISEMLIGLDYKIRKSQDEASLRYKLINCKKKSLIVSFDKRLVKIERCFDSGKKIGVSPGYLRSALRLHESIVNSIDPCDDFYEHACSKYLKTHQIPAHQSRISEVFALIDKTEEDMRTLLDSAEDPSSTAIQKMKSIYRSCLKEEEYVDKAPGEVLKAIRSFGVWPLLDGADNWNPQPMHFQTVLEKLGREQRMGAGFFDFSIERDPKNLTRQILQFDQGGYFLMPMNYYRNRSAYDTEYSAIRKSILDKIKFFADAVNIPENPYLEVQLDEILAFATRIAKIAQLSDERRDANAMYNLQSFGAFNERMKYHMIYEAKEHALALFPIVAHDLVNSQDAQINIVNPNFVKFLSMEVARTNVKILHNYEMLRLFLSFEDFYGPKYRDITFKLKQKLKGLKEMSPWWKFCNDQAQKMSKAYGALYARNYFDEESKESMIQMIDNLKAAFMEMVDLNEWMDEETKEQAKKKALEMIPLIGYNELAFDDEGLDKYYEKIDISPSDNFMTISRKVEEFGFVRAIENLMNPRNRHEFVGIASDVNAYHKFEKNAILFPGAFLQFPFFLKDQPQALNYGGIGSVIGHEITHGFDDVGKEYDDQGNLRNWWGKGIKERYEERAQCLIDQYSAIEVPGTGMKINGKLTAGENIADAGGIREAFRAYQKYKNNHDEEPSLPGLNISSEQAFFYGYSGFFCSKKTPEHEKFLLTIDNHSPDKYRVNVVLQNTPEFSEAFKCPLHSHMNPEKKCSVW